MYPVVLLRHFARILLRHLPPPPWNAILGWIERWSPVLMFHGASAHTYRLRVCLLTACCPYPAGPCPRGAAGLQQRAAYRPPGEVHEKSSYFLRLQIEQAQFSWGASWMPATSAWFCGFPHHSFLSPGAAFLMFSSLHLLALGRTLCQPWRKLSARRYVCKREYRRPSSKPTDVLRSAQAFFTQEAIDAIVDTTVGKQAARILVVSFGCTHAHRRPRPHVLWRLKGHPWWCEVFSQKQEQQRVSKQRVTLLVLRFSRLSHAVFVFWCGLLLFSLLPSGPCLAVRASTENILEWRGGNRGKVHQNSIF